MADEFESLRPSLNSPASNHFSITPSDSVDMALKPRAIYANTGGTAALVDGAGVVVTYDVVAGQTLAFRPVRVNATGTTATLIGWY